MKALPLGVPLSCEACGSTEQVQLEDARTSYTAPPHHPTRYDRLLLEDPLKDDPPAPPDPNAPLLLCRDCAVTHHEMWDEQWQEYHRGLL